MNRIALTMTLAAAALAFSMAGVAEAREGRIAARGQNGAVIAGAGPNGGAVVRGRGAVQNEDGSVTAGSAGAVRTPSGGRAARASTTTANPDGSATRRGGFAAEGANGSVASSGSATRNADGTASGSRSTSATNAAGGTYQGTTTYDSATGITRTTVCTDPSGATVACPR
jgi:hypothetical protein